MAREGFMKRLKLINWKETVGKYLLGAILTFVCFLTYAFFEWIRVGTDNLATNILVILIISVIVWTVAEAANWIAWLPAILMGLGGCPTGCGWLLGFCLIIVTTLCFVQQYYPFEKVSFLNNGSIIGISIIVALTCLSIRTQTTGALSQDAWD